MAEAAGIDRIGDTTGFDATFIPTAVAVRTGTQDPIWVYSGKSETQEYARLGALMEAVGRTTALWDVSKVIFRSVTELPDEDDVWLPERFTYPLSGEENLTWCRAERLISKRPIWVPADMVFWGRRPSELPPSPFTLNTTNGLAAHTDKDKAILAALMELMERHLVSLLDVRNSVVTKLKLAKLAARLGVALPEHIDDDAEGVVEVELKSLPERPLNLFNLYAKAGYQPRILALPNSFGLPLFAAAVIERMPGGEFLAAAGYGLKVDPEDACVAALLELAQSRATDRQGSPRRLRDRDQGTARK